MSERQRIREKRVKKPGERLLNVYERLVAEKSAGAYRTNIEGWHVVFSHSFDSFEGGALLVFTIRTEEVNPNDTRQETDFIHILSDEPNNWRPANLTLELSRKELLNRLTILADLAEQAEW